MTTIIIKPPKVPNEILSNVKVEKPSKDSLFFYGIIIPFTVYGGLEKTIITVNLSVPMELQPELTAAIKSNRPYINP